MLSNRPQEKGVMDDVRRQYLNSLMFIIFLDEAEPDE